MALTAPVSDVRVVPMTLHTAEVRVTVDGAVLRIGRVASSQGRWYWQHRDGEQSSPIAANRAEAAAALANYHWSFKQPPPSEAPVRKLLFG
jgi:hypothetical protein